LLFVEHGISYHLKTKKEETYLSKNGFILIGREEEKMRKWQE
jgi:hypothetical protein